MKITINGNVTINTTEGINQAVQAAEAAGAAEAVQGVQATTEAQQAEGRQPIDRTNEVLIDNSTSFAELVRMLSQSAEAKAAAKDEAEIREQESKEEKLRQIYGEDYEEIVSHSDSSKEAKLEKAKRRPGALQLRNFESRLAKIEIGQGGVCEVYKNGYAVYDNGNRKTVIWVPDCGSYTFYFGELRDNEKLYLSQKDEIGEDVLGELPWYQAIMLRGEDQIWANMDHPKSIGTSSDSDEDVSEVKANYRWIGGAHFESPEEALIRKEEEREYRESLTEKQNTAYDLYMEGYTQVQIAASMGISQPAVGKLLRKAARRRKEIFEKNLD